MQKQFWSSSMFCIIYICHVLWKELHRCRHILPCSVSREGLEASTKHPSNEEHIEHPTLGFQSFSSIKGARAPWREGWLQAWSKICTRWTRSMRDATSKQVGVEDADTSILTRRGQREAGTSWKSSQWPELEQLEQQRKVVLNVNPRAKQISLTSSLGNVL